MFHQHTPQETETRIIIMFIIVIGVHLFQSTKGFIGYNHILVLPCQCGDCFFQVSPYGLLVARSRRRVLIQTRHETACIDAPKLGRGRRGSCGLTFPVMATQIYKVIVVFIVLVVILLRSVMVMWINCCSSVFTRKIMRKAALNRRRGCFVRPNVPHKCRTELWLLLLLCVIQDD